MERKSRGIWRISKVKIVDESILFFSRVSQNSLWKLSTFGGYKGLYIVGWERNAKSQFFLNRVVWQLGLATGLSREFQPWVNGLANLGLLSYSATAGVALQLPCMLLMCLQLAALSRESPMSPSRETLHLCTILSISSHLLTHYPYKNPT